MGHPQRADGAELIHHVMARGNNKFPVFAEPADRKTFLRLLDRVARANRWVGLAHCVMTNHVHLVLRTPEPNLSTGMQRLLGHYARLFNETHERSGHVFGARFRSLLIESDQQLFNAVRYVLRNPIAAGLVDDARDWFGSSFTATIRGISSHFLNVPEVQRIFHSNAAHAPAVIVAAVHDDCSPPGFVEDLAGPTPFVARPTPWMLAALLDPEDTVRRCKARGYRSSEIAAALGVGTRDVRRLRNGS